MIFHPDVMYKDTHVLISLFFRDNRGIAESFAHPFGVHRNVPSAWGNPKPSDINPNGSGKGNPLDQGERFIKLVHPTDPARAREMAENFIALVDELDRRTGVDHVREHHNPSGLLARSICEHADIAAKLLGGELTKEKLQEAMVEIRQAEVALLQLKGGVEALIQDFPDGGRNA